MAKTRKEIIDTYRKRVEEAYVNGYLNKLLKIVEEAYDKGTEVGYEAGMADKIALEYPRN